jgi:23S rRNA pseudouridine1911/1915/1917 synthase
MKPFMLEVITHTIPREWHGLRVDRAIASLFPEYSRSQLTDWLKSGRVIVNNRAYKPKEKIIGGEVVTLTPLNPMDAPTSDYSPEVIAINIVFEDEYCLVVNKPAGLVVHPGAGNPMHTLVNALIHHDPKLTHLPRAGLIHRLDKDTSGLLVIAKTEAAHTSLIRQMQARDIQRHYLALVHGHVIAGGHIETNFGRHPRNRLKMAVTTHGKEAITTFSVQKHYLGTTLLNVKLMTGRTHQIRVHMAHIHHPVVGDPLYSGRTRNPSGLTPEKRSFFLNFKRQALHACSLAFHHPITQEILTFTAPLPDDFQSLLHVLDPAHDALDG